MLEYGFYAFDSNDGNGWQTTSNTNTNTNPNSNIDTNTNRNVTNTSSVQSTLGSILISKIINNIQISNLFI